MQKPSSSSAMDEQVQEAMRVLSLQVDFTQEQLRKKITGYRSGIIQIKVDLRKQ